MTSIKVSSPSLASLSAAEADGRASLPELLGILEHNQGLVEFADSKAGSLILLNSLLIAAVTALPNAGTVGLFKLAAVLVASAAVFLCFQVITSRPASADSESSPLARKKVGGWESDDFVFFATIAAHRDGQEYARAFSQSRPEARHQALLRRSYVLATIAQRKFSQYAVAQQVTTAAMAVWVSANMLPFLI